MGPGLDRPLRHTQQARDLRLGQVQVEAQHDGAALAGGKPLQLRPEQLAVATEVRLVAVLILPPAGEEVPGLHSRPAHQRAVAVEQDLAGVRRCTVVSPQPPPGGVGARHGVLGQLVGLMPVAGQQETDPSQRPILVGEEVQELPFVCGHDLHHDAMREPEVAASSGRRCTSPALRRLTGFRSFAERTYLVSLAHWAASTNGGKPRPERGNRSCSFPRSILRSWRRPTRPLHQHAGRVECEGS
jgi:hypothetical protein